MTRAASVYAQALYSLAKDEACSETVLKEVAALSESFGQEPGFLRLLSAYALSKQERCRIIDSSFRGKLHPYVLNSLKILTEKGYARHFADCAAAYRQAYNRDHGILEVTAVTAMDLSHDQRDRLAEKLTRLTGKTIVLVNRVDPACLGGIRLDYDGKRMDDTVANRLKALGAMLKNTAL